MQCTLLELHIQMEIMMGASFMRQISPELWICPGLKCPTRKRHTTCYYKTIDDICHHLVQEISWTQNLYYIAWLEEKYNLKDLAWWNSTLNSRRCRQRHSKKQHQQQDKN